MRKIFHFIMATVLTLTIMPANGVAETYTGGDVVHLAYKYVGVPYLYGGMTPSAFDCSGLVQYVYEQVGVTLPRTAKEQYTIGTEVLKSNLQLGDLVFFSNSATSGITHVGIYVGNNHFISATTSSGVIVSNIDSSYWSAIYTGAKCVLGTQSSIYFSDMEPTHFAYDAVQYLTSQDIINGYIDGTFRPTQSVTRGQAAAIINRVLQYTPKNSISFKDVSSGHIFAKDIAAMKELGIIQGFVDGTYRPNDTMTRAQMAVIVKNAFNLQLTNISSTEANKLYSDISSSYWAFTEIIMMHVIDQTTGFKTSTYRPTSNATRADLSAAVYNAVFAK